MVKVKHVTSLQQVVTDYNKTHSEKLSKDIGKTTIRGNKVCLIYDKSNPLNPKWKVEELSLIQRIRYQYFSRDKVISEKKIVAQAKKDLGIKDQSVKTLKDVLSHGELIIDVHKTRKQEKPAGQMQKEVDLIKQEVNWKEELEGYEPGTYTIVKTGKGHSLFYRGENGVHEKSLSKADPLGDHYEMEIETEIPALLDGDTSDKVVIPFFGSSKEIVEEFHKELARDGKEKEAKLDFKPYNR